MKANLIEMEGFLRGKCLPGDMLVNETNAEYLVRKFAEAEAKCAALAAENAGLNAFVDAVLSIAWQGGSADGADIEELALKHGLIRQEVYSQDDHENQVDDPGNFEDGDPVYFRVETHATDAFLAEVRAQGVTEYASKRGFSFQHGSIHAHFGNGDVMVGATKFENGHAGICFAPVREKDGGVGTEYKWTEGKNTEQVDSVFVISSSNVEGLEVIQGKLSEAITQLRQGVQS